MHYVISLGGSLIVPKNGINITFLKKFRALIKQRVDLGDKFFLISGGGITARNYTQAAAKIIKVSAEDQDWLGIHSTRLNAHLLRTIFFDIAHPKIIKNPEESIETKKPVVIAAGWRPGRSTDYVAVTIAEKYGIKTVLNLSNIDFVYDKDPKKFKSAKKIENINWKDFKKIVGTKWSPGLNAPFDPIASQKSDELNLKVIIMGPDIKNLSNFFQNKSFRGTLVSN